MNKKQLDLFKEKAKEKNKQLLIENVLVNNKNIEIFETPKLIESIDNNQYKARAVIRNVPTSKFIENLNGRIYPRSLDEKLIKEGTAEGTLSLADHPEGDDDGSITKICGVWHNHRIDENYSYGDWYLVGDHGQTIKEAIEAGGRIGVSRVGYGNFLEDEKTVDPESYELERFGDAVINPSQGVFAKFENLYNPATLNTGIPQEKQQESNIFKNEITNNKVIKESIETNIDQKIIKEVQNNMDKIHESAFKNQINKALKEAVKNENILEAIDELNCLDIPVEYVELKEKKENTVSVLQAKLAEQKANMEKTLSEKEQGYTELKEKYEVQSKTLEGMKEKFLKFQEALKKNGIAELKDVSVLQENIKSMKSDMDILIKERKDMEADIKIFEEDTKHRDLDIEKFKELQAKNKKQIEDTIKEKNEVLTKIKEFSKKLKHAEKYIVNLRNRLKEEGVDDEEIEQLGSIKDDEITEDAELVTVEGDVKPQVEVKEEDGEEVVTVDGSSKKDDVISEDNELVTVEGDTAPQQVEVKEEDEIVADSEEDEDTVMTEEDTDPAEFTGIEDGSESDEDDTMTEDADDDKMAAVRAAQDGGDPAIGSSKKEEKITKYVFSTVDPKKSLKEKKIVKPVINKDIVSFYENQVNKTPFLKNFEKQILSSKSLLEAVNKIDKIKEQKEDKVVKMDTQETKTTWVPKGRW